MTWTLDALAAATGGEAVGSALVSAFSIDSRRLAAGSLFVALHGERRDGHDFVESALASGAVACMVERGRLPAGAAGVEVADTGAALLALGAAGRDRISAPVVAVTGSNGKTTTKDMIAAVLGPEAHAAPRSFNNEIGLPLTVLAAPSQASAVVLEVGSRGIGHIRALAPSIRPDVAVITNVGPAHLETFGNVETVLRAKWELVDALGPHGVAVLPADLEPAGTVPGSVLRFGEGPDADVSIGDPIADDLGRVSCALRYRGEAVPLALPIPGRHQARNAAAAVAVGLVLGHDLGEAAARVTAASLSPWRMELSEIPLAGGSARVLNDAYNANPLSMAAALETVAAMPGRHVAVLGKMHELGSEERRYHLEAGALAASLGFSVVIVVGEDPGIADGAGEIAVTVPDTTAAVGLLRAMLQPGDVVVVKASRAAGLERVAEGLLDGRAA